MIKNMTDYFYLTDSKDKNKPIPVPSEDMIKAVLSIARKNKLKITDDLILKELGLRKVTKIKAPARKA